MRKSLILVLAFCLLTIVAAGQRKAPPKFSDYAVKVEKIKPAKLDLSDPEDRTFRTRLRAAAKRGVNFAGHYLVTAWGCGTGCLNGVVINAKTGKIYYPKFLNNFGLGNGEWAQNLEAVDFKINSRLLVINGFIGGEDELNDEGKYYLEWTGTDFKRVYFEKKQGLNEQ